MGHSVPRYLLSGVERGTVTEASEKRTKERARKMTHSGETEAQNKCQDKGKWACKKGK